MKTIFVAWKDIRGDGGWFPIGRLDADTAAERYEFRYIRGALHAAKDRGFEPFDSFPDFEGEYVSGELFPFFANRVHNSSRPSFKEYLRLLNIEETQDVPVDPLDVLAINEGPRATDNLEIFPKI